MNPIARILFRFIVLPLAVCGVFIIGAYIWLTSSLPETDGELSLQGLKSNVTIGRTEHGLAEITAETIEDAWFGLGVAHAQDRLWQMASMRRFALGRLSEVIGPDTFDLDVRQRRLGFGRLARAQFDLLDAKTKAALIQYASGVNAYLAARSGALPLPFVVLGFEPERWEPWHGLLWGRLMAYQLSARWREDLVREELLGDISPIKLGEIWPELVDERRSGASRMDIPPQFGPVPRGASNAWAVAPSKSTTGAAILAGDPHLGLSLPGIWYAARLKTPRRTVEGATAPGVPFVIMGRNEDFAWSFTSNEADLQDVAHVSEANVTRRVIEHIEIEGEDTQQITVSFVGDAPVMSGALAENGTGDGLALLATPLMADDRTPNALLGLNNAATVDDGIAALTAFTSPLMNVHMADRSGNIARAHAGVFPERYPGVSGRLPLRAETMWPKAPTRLLGINVINPDTGYIGNGNERTPGLPAHFTGDWPEDTRGLRIRNLLDQNKSFGEIDMANMQADTVDVTWRVWRPAIERAVLNPLAQQARDALMNWDGAMRADRVQPLIYAAWIAELQKNLFADELGDKFRQVALPGPIKVHRMIASESRWCDNVSTQGTETCEAVAVTSFVAAVDALALQHGEDIKDWLWGKTHVAFFRHTVLRRLPLYGYEFDANVVTHGGDRTLNRGASPRGSDVESGFPHVHGAGFRAVHDMAGKPSGYMLAPGQSGNGFSDHYEDLLELWRDGRYLSFDAQKVSTLTLVPGP